MFLPIIFPFAFGGGNPQQPTTSGPVILVIIGALVFGATGGIGYLVLGAWGLLAVPMLAALLVWCFVWCWLADQCMGHSLVSKGIEAGIYTGAGLLCLMIALTSFAGAGTALVASIIH